MRPPRLPVQFAKVEENVTQLSLFTMLSELQLVKPDGLQVQTDDNCFSRWVVCLLLLLNFFEAYILQYPHKTIRGPITTPIVKCL